MTVHNANIISLLVYVLYYHHILFHRLHIPVNNFSKNVYILYSFYVHAKNYCELRV